MAVVETEILSQQLPWLTEKKRKRLNDIRSSDQGLKPVPFEYEYKFYPVDRDVLRVSGEMRPLGRHGHVA
jgi:hypothetical protein